MLIPIYYSFENVHSYGFIKVNYFYCSELNKTWLAIVEMNLSKLRRYT